MIVLGALFAALGLYAISVIYARRTANADAPVVTEIDTAHQDGAWLYRLRGAVRHGRARVISTRTRGGAQHVVLAWGSCAHWPLILLRVATWQFTVKMPSGHAHHLSTHWPGLPITQIHAVACDPFFAGEWLDLRHYVLVDIDHDGRAGARTPTRLDSWRDGHQLISPCAWIAPANAFGIQ